MIIGIQCEKIKEILLEDKTINIMFVPSIFIGIDFSGIWELFPPEGSSQLLPEKIVRNVQ